MPPRRHHAAASARTRVRRLPERGRYDREAIDAVLDAGLVAHLGFVSDGQPFVIPTLHARVGDEVYVHGSSASRTLRELSDGIAACLTVTLLDGIVLARSVFEHSMNYRSVGRPRDGDARRRAGREARGARGVHREAPPGALGGGAAAEREGAQGDVRAPYAARRGVGEDPRRRPRGRRDAGRRARRVGWAPPARRDGARARRPTRRSGPESRCRRRCALPAPGARRVATLCSVHAPEFDTVVMKFGGSSVADPEKIRHVAQRFVDAKRRGLNVVGTVSAMGKTTDQLLALASDVSPTPNPRELDMLLSTGERIACALVAMAIDDLGEEAVSYTGSQAGILTDSAHTKAKIREIRGDRIRASLEEGKIVLVAGFQGFSRDTMEITTLGRGGTDATAVALAAALGAACEIYSDVPGVFTADPRIVPKRAQAACRLLRRDARDGGLRGEGADAPLGRARAQSWGAHPRTLDVLRRGGNLGDRLRGNGAGDHLGRHPLGDRRRLHADRHPRPARRRGDDLRPGRAGAGQRRHDHPERRPRTGGDVVLGACGGRAGDAGGDRVDRRPSSAASRSR